MRIGKFLNFLKTVMALLALVFVKWHGLPETLLKRDKLSAVSSQFSAWMPEVKLMADHRRLFT
jgi:hypothetical protein